ncbi:hypothetical protein O2K51_03920, partial [Apibacter raozihei]|uniref:hypothetical protein n=1 Tax=Apibacter raozihei TaxID=2500547 RepID=UPI003EDC71E6
MNSDEISRKRLKETDSSEEYSNFKLYTQQEIEQLNKGSYYARYGGNKDSQYGNSSLVSISVQIQGVD